MKQCRLKIITAYINSDEKEPDKEIIHYVSENQKDISEYQQDYNIDFKKEEIEKNNTGDIQKDEEEEEAIIIRDKNDLKKKKKQKINKEKVYLIDGLFSSNANVIKKNLFKSPVQINNLNISHVKPNKKKEKNSQKIPLEKIVKAHNEINEKISSSINKLEPKYDNKTNTFYNSKSNKISSGSSPIKLYAAKKIFHAPDNPFVFNFYKTNKEIDHNIAGLYNYKKKIKELLEQEPKKIKDRDNIMNENNPKIEILLKENKKLNFELEFEINREDELKGEIIILKNQYEILFDFLGKEEIKIKQYQDIIKHKENHEKIIINKQNEIINYYNILNDCLEKGEILIITRPDLYDKFNYLNSKNIEGKINGKNENNNGDIDNKNINDKHSENNRNKKNKINNEDIDTNNDRDINLKTNFEIINEIDKNSEINNYLNYDIITLLLKGYFINMNFKNVDEIVNKIWIYEKPIQTFESLTEELLILIDNYISSPNSTFINMHNRNIIMNYFYSFCNCYNYMTKNEFISIFNDKLGDFIEPNENYLMNKLYKHCHGRLGQFIENFQNLEKENIDKFNIYEFIKALKDNDLVINSKYRQNLNNIEEGNLIEQKDIIDLIQLLIIYMKKNIKIDEKIIENENKDNLIEKKEINIYELYYECVLNIIRENKNSKTPLYKGIIKKYLVENNINSMMDFMEPLLLNHDIIINKGLNRYIKIDVFNNFLISKNVIGKKDEFIIPYNEESLIEINQLVHEIDGAQPLLNDFEENREKIINDIINIIDDN